MADVTVQQLKDKAKAGLEEIENGDIHRSQVTHVAFSEIVPESQEDAVIKTMFESGEWHCSLSGFDLKSLYFSARP